MYFENQLVILIAILSTVYDYKMIIIHHFMNYSPFLWMGEHGAQAFEKQTSLKVEKKNKAVFKEKLQEKGKR